MKKGMRMMGAMVLFFLIGVQGLLAQVGGITEKSQVVFQKDETGYVFFAPGIDLKAFDTVVIGPFSIEGLPDIGPGKKEEYREAYRSQLKSKLSAAGIFKEVTDDLSRASGPNSLIISGDFLALHPGSASARFWVGMGAGKAVVEIKTYVSSAEEKKILLAHHLRPTSGARGGLLGAGSGYEYLHKGVDRISTLCVEYIKRVYQTGQKELKN